MKPFDNAMLQLGQIEEHIENKELLNVLRKPQRSLEVFFPVRMDDGQLRIFEGYRVQYNNYRGPYKGGIRFHPDADINEVNALSFWMTLKTAALDLPLGGGKGGVKVDPKQLSGSELERLTRAFTRAIAPDIGSQIDIPAPDVYTNATIMDWIVDEYAKVTGKKDFGVVTGKTLENGGSKGRDRATAQGGYYILEQFVKDHSLSPADMKIAIQGIGNAGGVMAELCLDGGYKVVAISDSRGALYSPEGLDVKQVLAYKNEHGNLSGYQGAQMIENKQLLELDVDVLIPAALENQIHEENVQHVKAKYILELANGPVTSAADNVLREKGIVVIPDILANAGGVTVSYFEWYQNVHEEHWELEKVLSQLRERMIHAYTSISGIAQEKNVSLRQAAFIFAISNIEKACEQEKRLA